MASIEYTGRTFSLGLSSRISTDFQKPESVSVSILLSNAGQYRTSGNINGRPVSFLVDTGATIIALNTPTAKALGLDLSKARPLRATTAGGVVESREVNLASVEVGGIRINNVKAAVLEGDYPEEILLGMSFLSKVDLTESAGIMQLTVKY
ncbi:MAG TPA: TIGR02281 family clan AA aspartic protease [Pseudomonadales bacterium]|nr:TIGR02281 family clan AA aspartic protease [Pseudomonadales bacterium]